MGLLISRFRRKKNTRDTLEQLEKRIKSAEQYGHSTELRRKRLIGNLMVVSVGLYVLASVIAYWYFRPGGWKDGLLYTTPLLVFPIIIIAIRTGLTRYYNWKLRRSRDRLQDMRSEKKKLLEEVMDTETYKVAKELLDKFGNTDTPISSPPVNSSAKPFAKALVPSSNVLATPGQVRQRQLGPPGLKDSPNQMALMGSPARTPVLTAAYPGQLRPLESDQLPRPILGATGASGGGAFDRLVDYLVGDGPGSRYALICAHCKGHNGMAMPEEFEYVSYRCAYCRFLNPARKQRPKQPPLMSTTPMKSINRYPMNSSANSESEDSDREKMSFRGSNPNISSQSVSPLLQSPEVKPEIESEGSSNDEKILDQEVEEPETVNHRVEGEEVTSAPIEEEAAKDEDAKKQD